MADQSDESLRLDDLEDEVDINGFNKDIYDGSQEYKDSFNTSKEDSTYDDDIQETGYTHTRSEDIIRQYHKDQESRSNSSNRSRTPSEDYVRTGTRSSSSKEDPRTRSNRQQRTQSEDLVRSRDRKDPRTSAKSGTRTRGNRQDLRHSSEDHARIRDRQGSRTSSNKDDARPRSSRQESRIPHEGLTRTRGKSESIHSSEEGSQISGDGSQLAEFSNGVDDIAEGENEDAPHQDHHQHDGNEEFFDDLDSYGEDTETLMTSSDVEVDCEPRIIHLDHVDYILDNIDAELSHLINKSTVKTVKASPKSKGSSPGTDTSHTMQSEASRHRGKGRREQQRKKSRHYHYRDGTDEGTVDTGLGSGSPMEEAEENNNTPQKSSKQQSTKGKKRLSAPLKIPIIEISDADSVTSEDVQIRLQETLRKHDPNHAASSPSMHANPSNHSNSTLTRRSLVENYSKLDSSDLEVVRDYGRQNEDENYNDSYDFHTDVMQQDSKPQNTQGSISRPQTPDSVSRSKSKTNVSQSHLQGSVSRPQRSRTSTQSTQRSIQESERSRSRSSSRASAHQRSRSYTNDDKDSIATEDFEQVFKSTNTPNSSVQSSRFLYDTAQSSRILQSSKKRYSAKTVGNKLAYGPVRANHELVLTEANHEQHYIDETPKKRPQFRKHRKSNSMPGMPSGLPEYMYLRKDVGESDLGSDSIRTEDYEGLFAMSTIPNQDINPKSSSIGQRGSPKTYGGQMSDPESVRTEEFERHFRGMMVKQVAGVPVRNFDAVTIVSDLDSVRTTDVYQKFQDALHRGDHSGKDTSNNYLRPSNVGHEVKRKHRPNGKQRRLQRTDRVMDYESDQVSGQDSSLSDGDSINTGSEEYGRNDQGNITGGDKRHDVQTNKGAKRARDKERDQRAAAAVAAPTGLRKLLAPGSPRKSHSFPELASTPKAGNTPERSPCHSPPRTPTLLAPPPRFKDHSKLRQTRSFDDTLKSSQGQQPQVYQWADQSFSQSFNHRQSPQWISSRQDSVSTYEEVESLSSHRVSSANSRSTSEGPSRLPSFGSSGSSLDRSGEYAFAWRLAGIENEDLMPEVEKAPENVSRSGSVRSSSPSLSYSGSKRSERSSVSDGTSQSESDLQSDIAKWVDQTRMETARKHSNAGLEDVEIIKSNEAPERPTPQSPVSKKQPVLLNMQCGDVIAGSSMEKMQLPNETDKELNLRLRNTSPAPISGFSRTTSFDSSSSSYSDLRNDIAWTPAEDVLMNLGFAGPDLGIPERFLTSWREKVYHKRMENMRKLLRSHSSQSEPDYFVPRLHVMEKVQEEPHSVRAPAPNPNPAPVSRPALQASISPVRASISPVRASVPPARASVSPVRERPHKQNKSEVPSPKKQSSVSQRTQPKQVISMNACDACTDTSDLQGSSHHISQSSRSVQPPPLQPQTSVERLHQYRKRLMKAATVSNFGKTLSDMARNRRMQPNMAPPEGNPPPMPSDAQIQQDLQRRMNMAAMKKPRSSGRGRRRHFVKQSSLPVSLETLPEEEELIKPNMRSQRSISLDVDEPILRRVPLKIVMEQPSIESREAMSRQGTRDFDIDEAIADVDGDQKHTDKLERYLTVVKDIIESKDSGFENESSQNGSPQHMSPRSVEVEFGHKSEPVLNQKQQNSAEKSNSKSLQNGNHQTQRLSGKENKPPDESNRLRENNSGTHLEVNSKDCLDVQSVSSRNSSRSDDSMFSEEKSHQDSRRSSVSSDKSISTRSSIGTRPSLVDMQEVFCQTIEEDDDSVFMTSPVPPEGEEVECVCICIQTSPGLNSPPLSPLECGFGYLDQAMRNTRITDTGVAAGRSENEENIEKMSAADNMQKRQVLRRTMSNACNQASLDASEPFLLEHPIKPMQNSNRTSSHQGKSEPKEIQKRNDKTSNESKTSLPQLDEETNIQAVVQPLSQSQPNIVGKVNSAVDISRRSEPSAAHDEMSLPTDDDNSTEWPEMGPSPTTEELDTFVQDNSAGFVSDSDCLLESEEEQLAEKHTQLRRRRSLRPEWATPERRERLLASGGGSQLGESSDGSEISVGRHRRVKVTRKDGSEVKSDIDDDSRHDRSDSDGRRSNTSTSDVLSIITHGTGESSPSSVYRYGNVNANQDNLKPSDLIRSNSDLIKRLSAPKSAQSLASHTPLKRSLSVEALNPYFMRTRTLSERGYRPSDVVNFNDPLGSSKHYNTLRGSSSTGGYKGRMRVPMNTPETLKLASMKLERLIHKGALRPITYNESFQEETTEEEEEYQRGDDDKLKTTRSHTNDSKKVEKIRDEHIRLPDNKATEAASASPNSFLFPSPSSERLDGDKKGNIRQNSNVSDRSQTSSDNIRQNSSLSDRSQSSDKSLQSPGTIPAILTKGPTLESMDSLEVGCYSDMGSEKRPPLRSRDFCAWSSQSSSPGLLAIPSFHSPDMFDFESRPKTSSPSEMENGVESNLIVIEPQVEEDIKQPNLDFEDTHNTKMEPRLTKDNLELSVSNSFSIRLPISPRKFDQLFIDTPTSTLASSSSLHSPMIQGDSEDGKDENIDSKFEFTKPNYYSSTHHEISHTVPLPKLSVTENGRKIPTMLHKLATLPSVTNAKGKPFTVHLEIPPVNLKEINNNSESIFEEKQKHTSVKVLEMSSKQELDINDKENENDWINDQHYRAPYYWDVTDPIPVFPLYRDGHLTSNVPPHPHRNSFIPRNGGLHDGYATMPTFDEICNKAGRLIQNLERTDLERTPRVERFLPVEPAPQERESNQCGQEGSTTDGNHGNSHNVVVINVVDHAEGNSTHGGNSERDTNVIQDEEAAIEEETFKVTHQGLEGASLMTGISKAQKKLNGNQLETPPDWGAKLESLANLEDLMETERDMRRRLNSFQQSYDEVKNKKQVALKELKTLQEAVHRNKADIQKAEGMTSQNLEKADGIRSELVVLEYQRDQARRELQDLEESIQARHGSPRKESWTINASDQDLLNITPGEIQDIIQERDDLKSRLRRGQGDLSPIERSELERQLSSTKKDLFEERKSSRARMDQLEEELEESRLRIEELGNEKSELSIQVEHLNESLHAAEENSLRNDVTHKLQEENTQLHQDVKDKDEYIVAAKSSIREKEQTVTKQREEAMKMKRQLVAIKDSNEALMEERKDDFKKLNMDKQLAVDEMKDVLKKEHRLVLEQLRSSLFKDRKEALARQEEKLQEQMAVKHSLLLTKEEELILLKDDMKRSKRSAEQAEDDRALEMQQKIQDVLDKAQETWEEEMGRNKRREQAMREEEFAKETARLHEEIRREKMKTENTKTTIGALKEEIAELQEKRLAAGREKVEAVSEARDAIRQEMQTEWGNLRQQLTQEKLQEVERLKEKLSQKDDELDKLRSEVKKKVHRVTTDTIDKTTSRGIISEITEECKRTASIMETHKKINGLKTDKNSKSPHPSPSNSSTSTSNQINGYHGNTPGRAQVLAALTNLRSSNEELRSYVQTVKEDLEKQKKMVTKLSKDKDAEVKRLNEEQVKQQKSQGDVEVMKDRLVQDHLKVVDDLQHTVRSLQSSGSDLKHKMSKKDEELRDIQRGMAKWKEESAFKMAQKFEDELNRELEIRLQEKEARQKLLHSGPKQDYESELMSPSKTPPTDATTIKHLRTLQDRVRHLQAENISLRQSGRTFPNDKSPQSSQNEAKEKEQEIYQLQQRVMLLDRQRHIAEDRCRDNAAHLSEKETNNNKLQGALAQQTKELMRMERAYAKLSQAARRQPVAL